MSCDLYNTSRRVCHKKLRYLRIGKQGLLHIPQLLTSEFKFWHVSGLPTPPHLQHDVMLVHRTYGEDCQKSEGGTRVRCNHAARGSLLRCLQGATKVRRPQPVGIFSTIRVSTTCNVSCPGRHLTRCNLKIIPTLAKAGLTV